MRRVLLVLAFAVCAHGLFAPNLQGTVGKFMRKMMHAKNYKKEYDKINNWLVDNIKGQEAARNVIAVKEHFLGAGSKRSLRMVEAATQLVSLSGESFREIKCTPKALEILEANQASTRNLMDERAMRRIDRIVLHYLHQHSLDCRNIYPEMTKKATSNYGSRCTIQVLSFVDYRLSPWLASYLDDEERYIKEAPQYIPPQSVVRFIETQESERIRPVQDEKTGKRSIDERAIEALVNKHIFEPCEEFLSQVTSIFKSYVFDVKVMPDEGLTQFVGRPFARTLIGYHWCNIALKSKKRTLDKILQSLLEDFSIAH